MQPSPKCQSPGRGHSGQYARPGCIIPLTIPPPIYPFSLIFPLCHSTHHPAPCVFAFWCFEVLALKNALPHGVRQKTIGIFLRAACPGISGMGIPAIEPRSRKWGPRTLTYAECHHDFWQLASWVHDGPAVLSAADLYSNMIALLYIHTCTFHILIL